MQIINASNWLHIEDTYSITYYTGGLVPFNEKCANTYVPFAWISVNKKTKDLVAARDHFGQEPFYYTIHQENLIVGSTIPDLLKHVTPAPRLSQHCINDSVVSKVITCRMYVNETYHDGIFRVTPGHFLSIKKEGRTETPFWQLDPHKPPITYRDQHEYFAHFSSLLEEAVKQAVDKDSPFALEFSGGVDSSLILSACHKIDLKPYLFTHKPSPHRAWMDEDRNVKQILQQLQCAERHQYVGVDNFDPIATFKQFSQIFAGPSPQLFQMLSHETYQAALQKGCHTLLSGFGGDECVSAHYPLLAVYTQQKQEQGIWPALANCYRLANMNRASMKDRMHSALALWQVIAPKTFNRLYHLLKNKKTADKDPKIKQFNQRCTSLQEYEYAVLQGKWSHEIRMRIEYNAVAAKAIGFRFAYPLLYPPLVEFCFRLPFDQKVRRGLMRCLARQYIEQYIPHMRYDTKQGSFIPSALQKCRLDYAAGQFDSIFSDLPFENYSEYLTSPEKKLIFGIKAFMMKEYYQSQKNHAK